MDNTIEVIRAAVATDAGAAERAAGIKACRAVLAALEATPGQAMHTPPADASQIPMLLGALRSVPRDQLLDLVIARLRAALPSGDGAERPAIRFHLPAPVKPPTPGGKP